MKCSITLALLICWIAFTDVHCLANGTEPGLSFLKAKRQAELRDMKYVLYFKADWCTPCKWMEETTFQDETFTNSMDQNFIFVQLDIDAFEGYALKEYFHVHSLPTMLVFNEKHEIVNRKEGSMSASAFMQMLDQQIVLDQPVVNNESNEIINTRPTPSQSSSLVTSMDHVTAIEHQTAELPAAIIESVTKYGVQLGAFSSWNNAKAIQDQASQYTTEHIEITTVPNGDKIIYKVFAGRLENEDQASQLMRSLTSYGMNGFVKSIVVSIKS